MSPTVFLIVFSLSVFAVYVIVDRAIAWLFDRFPSGLQAPPRFSTSCRRDLEAERYYSSDGGDVI